MVRTYVPVAVILLCLIGSGGFSRTDASEEACDRECLEGFITQYLDAMVAHEPESLPLADSVRFTEDNKDLELGEGLWETVTGLDTYRMDILDVRYGGAFSFVVLRERNAQVLFCVRLKIEDRKISEVETMVVRKNGEELVSKFERLTTADPRMKKVPDSTVRNTRGELIDIASLYPEGLRAGSFDSVDVPFVPDECYRRENGFGTAGVGCEQAACENMLTQRFPYMPEVFDKLLIVDEELGIVVIRMNFGRNSISQENREYLDVWEAFKIYNDSMYAVEAFMQKLPANNERTCESLFGWEYDDITDEITAIRNPSPAEMPGTIAGKTIGTAGSVRVPLGSGCDGISIELYTVSGRLVHTESVAPVLKNAPVIVRMSNVPAGQYIGRIRYTTGGKVTQSSSFYFTAIP